MPSLDSRRTRILLIVGNLVLVFFVATIVRPVRISAHSMENTLCDGQLALVETLPASVPKRADIVFSASPAQICLLEDKAIL